jgi:hypothetical protein
LRGSLSRKTRLDRPTNQHRLRRGIAKARTSGDSSRDRSTLNQPPRSKPGRQAAPTRMAAALDARTHGGSSRVMSRRSACAEGETRLQTGR